MMDGVSTMDTGSNSVGPWMAPRTMA